MNRAVRGADLAELLFLASLWGGSFLFMRMGAAEFGPVALVAVRVVGASALLLPLLVWRGQWRGLLAHWRALWLVGLTNSALPFLCFSYAALTIPAGLSSIFNAATPLFGAVIAWVWLKDRLDASRSLGLMVGFLGVAGLAWQKAAATAGAAVTAAAGTTAAPGPNALPSGVDAPTAAVAVLACLTAAALYGWSASYTKRRLSQVPPLVVATGSQVSASLAVIVPAAWAWPAQTPGTQAWVAAALLAFACTGVAYVVYFRLIGRIGPANAMSVTFLNPVFAVLWGLLVLGEWPTLSMALGGAVIVMGTALAVGLFKLPLGRRAARG